MCDSQARHTEQAGRRAAQDELLAQQEPYGHVQVDRATLSSFYPLTLRFADADAECRFVATHFREVHTLQQGLLGAVVVAALGVVQLGGEGPTATPARVAACVGATAMGVQYGAHLLPAPYAHVTNDALWLVLLLLGMGSFAHLSTQHTECPSVLYNLRGSVAHALTLAFAALGVLLHVLLLHFATRLLATCVVLTSVAYTRLLLEGEEHLVLLTGALFFVTLVARVLETRLRVLYQIAARPVR